MLQNRRILAICPARGGSKGIKLKNLRRLRGKSLVECLAEVTQQCPFLDKVVVSTDHPSIRSEALRVGLEAPFMRPENLSGDFVGDLPVLIHALQACESIYSMRFDVVVMLQPTSPLRRPEHIQSCVNHLLQGCYDSVWTVSPTPSKAHPLKQLLVHGERLSFYDPEGEKVIARQELPPVYHRNGLAYAFTRECLLEKQKLLTDNSSAIVTGEFYVNIDSTDDIQMAELYLSGSFIPDPSL